ncbi:MAG: hypothetical protein MI863_16490 [Desulfobacterales bacterium]|nr:hypothetical protein [Desulfobacterales bacterium]
MNPKTDYAAWRFWFDIGQYIVAALVALYIWISNKAKASGEDVKAVEKRIHKIDTRVTALESSQITKEDLAEVYDRLNDVSGLVNKLMGISGGTQKTVEMINKNLLNKGGKE